MPQIGSLDVFGLDLAQLHAAISVAEMGSFHKAARALSVGQSAISRRVSRLEDSLGVSLFERRPSGARLTNAGCRFVARARSIVDDLQVAVETAQTAGFAGNGHLRIGIKASLSKGAARTVIQTFTTEHADIDLCFEEADRSALLMMLSHRAVDVVIAPGETIGEMGGGHVLVWEDVYLAVPEDDPLAERERLTWSDVTASTFLVGTNEFGPEFQDHVARKISALGHVATIRRYGLDREGIMNLVGLGLGVSLVADQRRGTMHPNVSFVPIGERDERAAFSIMCRPENDNPALRRFLSLARVEAKMNGALS